MIRSLYKRNLRRMKKVDDIDGCTAVCSNSGTDTDRRLREHMTLNDIAIILGVILVMALIADEIWN